MTVAFWRDLLGSLLGVAGLVMGLCALVLMPLYGAFMVVWMQVPPMDIFLTVGPAMLVLALLAYAMWQGGQRLTRIG